ncbi:apolipoprotein N-acyltransferase [Prosthecobacter vanneervenii]|uniref:Apolipoprotein N-acyltransferase n=1 Tax=Prosthecobacter vanneervenii TaxID=48466 RepID=A0A7W7YDY8_9BACT|nr:nitrilase-related carbon-nitrogen hydrolase [Prosthecobacter vanneervenii]MBB5034394.1 apolipoprotein N-acyltransferase [Prosthecobacter vanneervenii]
MDRANRILLLFASAAAYAFAFPPYGWWPLALLSVAVLAGVLHQTRPAHGFRAGFAWGLLAFGTGLSWMWSLFGVFSIALWSILSLFPALFGWLVCTARQRGITTGWRLALFIALAWTGTEFVRCELMPLKFPWLHLGLALEPWPLASWVGVYGLGFLAAWMIASLITRCVRLAALLMAGVVLVPVREPELFKSAAIPVTAIQAETAPLNDYLELSRQAPPETRLIVWPEYAVSKDVRRSDSGELTAIQDISISSKALLVFGTQKRLEGARWQNTALAINEGAIVGEHGKNHTVHFFNDGEHGPTASAFEVTLGEDRLEPPFHGKIGTPICFDCDFHDVVRRMVLAGAEFLVVPSMDAASWPARQHIQHAQLFRARAAENRRCMIVAASSGVSQIIDQNGHATASLDAMQRGVLSGTITAINDLTFFTRWGWLTPWLALSILLLWTLWLLAFSKPKMPQPVEAGSD